MNEEKMHFLFGLKAVLSLPITQIRCEPEPFTSIQTSIYCRFQVSNAFLWLVIWNPLQQSYNILPSNGHISYG